MERRSATQTRRRSRTTSPRRTARHSHSSAESTRARRRLCRWRARWGAPGAPHVINGRIRLERPRQPQRAAQVAGAGRRTREREPLAVDLEGLRGVDEDVAVAIVRTGLGHGHLLVPAVLTADGIGLHRERQVLVHARFLPPDPLRVGIVALERSDAVHLAHPPLTRRVLTQVDERRAPALATEALVKAPAADVM